MWSRVYGGACVRVLGVNAIFHDPAAAAGRAARSAALDRYGPGRFLADWDMLIKEVTR